MHEHAARMKDGSLANSLEQAVIYLDSSRPARNSTEAHPMITSVYYLDKLTNLWSHQLLDGFIFHRYCRELMLRLEAKELSTELFLLCFTIIS